MTVDLVAAFVGALSAFALGEIGARALRRRAEIERAMFELMELLPSAVVSFQSPRTYDTTAQGQIVNRLVLIRAYARFPLRRCRAIREEVEDLSARIGAVELRSTRGKFVSGDDLTELLARDLAAAVFGKSSNLYRRTKWYADHGFTSGRPE